MENKGVLKILTGLVMFSLTVSVFAKTEGEKINISEKNKTVVDESKDAKLEKKKVKRIFESFLDKDSLEEESIGSKYFMLTFIKQDMKYSGEFRKFLKDKKIYTVDDIVKNFKDILIKIVDVKNDKIKRDKERLSKWEEITNSQEFKKQYTKYKNDAASSWKVCGASSPKYNNLEKSKAQKLVEKDVEKMLADAENYEGEAFLEYKKWKKEELESYIKHNKAAVDDINKILSTKNNLKTAVDVYKEVVNSCKKEQNKIFENFEKNLKNAIFNKKKLKKKVLN